MDIEKLIEQANRFGMELKRDGGEFEYSIGEKFLDYATALSTLYAKYKSRDSLVDSLEDDVARLTEENEMLKEALKKYEVF